MSFILWSRVHNYFTLKKLPPKNQNLLTFFCYLTDSDSEDEDSHFYSIDEIAKARKGTQEGLSFFSASINILRGRVTAWTDAKVVFYFVVLCLHLFSIRTFCNIRFAFFSSLCLL